MTTPYLQSFTDARLGLFIHFGLYTILGRGEWVLNREAIPVEEYRQLADRFDPHAFDADDLARRAKQAGCRYMVFTTMHHEGFALYDSKVNPFNSVNLGPKRDLVEEVVEACRRHDLGVHLYHSLNHWTAQPDAVDALEDPKAHKEFIDFTHERIRELLTRFNPIDCLWYDGWWPFDAQGWRAKEMNAMARQIQPDLIFNGRNGLPGDFATPEQHLSAPKPYRPWEACVTHNRHWCHHPGDTHFKSTADVLRMLTQVATGAGNLLVGVGPQPDGQLPDASNVMLEELGQWMQVHGQALYASEPLSFDAQQHDPAHHRGDWFPHGHFTARDQTLYLHLLDWPGPDFTISGLQAQVTDCRLMGIDLPITFKQEGTRVSFAGLPGESPYPLGGVLAVTCDRPPTMYLTGGQRTPQVPHPRYDPITSDLIY